MTLQEGDELIVYYYDNIVIYSSCHLDLNANIVGTGTKGEKFELNTIFSINDKIVNHN
jgi:hypothetical protein